MQKKTIYVILLLLIAAAVFLAFKKANTNMLGGISAFLTEGKTAAILSQAKTKANFRIEMADEQEERARGLSGRDSLDENSGMLFVFERPDLYSFWMKDMKFPLDLVWISGNKIIDLTENVPYPVEKAYLDLPRYQPKEPADKVLEINAGLIEKYGIEIGDEFEFHP